MRRSTCSSPWILLALACATSATIVMPAAAAEPVSEDPAPVHDLGIDGYEGPGFAIDLLQPDEPDGRPMQLTVGLFGALRGEVVSGFEVDRDGNEHDAGPTMNAHLRIGARFDSGTTISSIQLRAETEHDVPTGTVGPAQELAGEGYPSIGQADYQLRKANLGASVDRWVSLDVGWMTSHWGMGLLANDGAHGWEPGSARFIDPRSGDRVARLRLLTGPHPEALGLVVVFAADILDDDYFSDDDILLEGDHGRQFVGAVRLGDRKNFGGVYAAYRQQRTPVQNAVVVSDNRDTNVLAIDAHGRGEIVSGDAFVVFESEAAFIVGTTELAPSVDFPVHDVLQFGYAARISAGTPMLGGVFDFLYASGDRNLDDEQQNAFRPDPNFEMGLLLFRHVMAAQSARARFTAGDPSLVGIPVENLERLPTRGSAADTVAFFPRLRGRPIDGLELYGGPLVALAALPVTDPLNTRSNGGVPSSPLGGISGNILGYELDAGVRYRVSFGGTELTLGLEAGALKPGNALRDQQLENMDWVFGGRSMLDLRL
jgi:hypothetical protein